MTTPTEESPVVHLDRPEESITQVDFAPKAPHTSQHEDSDVEQSARQAAFDSEFDWHGKRLNPFSSSREALFAQLRLSMGAPELQRCLDDIDGFFADAARMLWICSHTSDDWGVLRCSPSDLQATIDKWCDENIAPYETSAATLIAYKIYAASRRNQHETAPSTRKEGADSGN
jgi:hypothetical protein